MWVGIVCVDVREVVEQASLVYVFEIKEKKHPSLAVVQGRYVI